MTIIPNKGVNRMKREQRKKEKLINNSWQVPCIIRVVDKGQRSILQGFL